MAPDEPSKREKRKRVVLTLTQKINILERLEKGENRNTLMKEYNVGASTLYDIKGQKEQLLKYMSCDSIKDSTRRTLHKPKLEELENALYEWFLSKRSEGVNVNGPMLIEKAKELYQQMGLNTSFSFSTGWLQRFRVRHGILKKLQGPGEKCGAESGGEQICDFLNNLVADHEATDKYCDFFNTLVADHNLSPDQIYNADATSLFWRCVPSSTLSSSTESSANVKKNKDRLTVLTCANAAGTHKLKLLVIGKYRRPKSFNGITNLPVVYKPHNKILMNVEIFHEWFHNLFVTSVKEHYKRIGKNEESETILLLNNCRTYPPELELVSGNIFTCFLPANVTSLIQPMGQGIVQSLKFYYRRDFLRRLVNHDESVCDFQNHYNFKDAIFNLACAWSLVKSETLKKAWKKLWPGVMFTQGMSDEEDTLAQIRDVVKDAHPSNPINKLQENEIEEWIEVDKDAESMPEKSKDKDKDFDESEIVDEQVVNWAEAATGIDTFIKFAEKQSCYSSDEVMQLYTIYSSFMQKRQAAHRQTEIKDLLRKALETCDKALGSTNLKTNPQNTTQPTSSSVIATETKNIHAPISSDVIASSPGVIFTPPFCEQQYYQQQYNFHH